MAHSEFDVMGELERLRHQLSECRQLVAALERDAPGRVIELQALAGCRRVKGIQELLRKHGYVFKTPLDAPVTDENRWEKLAFWLYTELCEVDDLCRRALEPDG